MIRCRLAFSAAALALAVPIQAQVPAHYLQVAERVAPRVHVLRQAEPAFAGVIGNVAIIEQSDGLVLVDSGSSYGVGKRVIELARKTSRKPVKAVVITHWHNDHPLGLSAIREEWPNAEIIAHEVTARRMAERMANIPQARSGEYEAERIAQLKDAYEKQLPELIAQAKTDAERAGWARAMAAKDLRLADVPGTYLVLPTRTFADRLTLNDSEAPVELLFLGRANTDGDISAWLPRQRVLVAGDAVVEPVPYMFNVFPSDILSTLDRMRALKPRVIVPGHGEPLKGTSYLDRLTALVVEAQRQVAPLAKDNVAADQIASRTDFAAQRTAFAGGDKWLAYWFDEYSLTPLLDSVYHEARGEPLGPPPVQTAASPAANAIPLTADRWEVQGEVAFEQRDGRQVMRLGAPATGKRSGAVANVKDLSFATGVIEYDVMLPDAMEFSGPMFHQPDENTGEYVYFRPHMNGKPDAIQYTPVVNGNLSWQIFTGPGFEAETTFPVNRWAHVRVDVYPASAAVSVDGKPVLAIPELKNGRLSGALGFASLMGGTYYSNVRVEAIEGYADPAAPPPPKALAHGTVERWQVSKALGQKDAFDRAAKRDWAGLSWQPIAVETNGVANLSKAGPDGDDEHSFIARFALRSPSAKSVPMQFGFSDDVRVYLNGIPLYEGSDRQGSRDYRFLGHVGFWDTVFLPLKAGDNEIAFVVTDPTNGGTAAAAIIPPGEGLQVAAR